MADRTSARLFGRIFEFLATKADDPAHKAFALEMWGIKEDVAADFSDYQMDADDALADLGLLRMVDGEPEYGPAE